MHDLNFLFQLLFSACLNTACLNFLFSNLAELRPFEIRQSQFESYT